MSDNDIKELTQHVEDAVTYPILTKEVDGGGAGDMTVTATGALGGGSINRLARDTIRSVLGWRYRENDVKGFTAALTRSFTSRELQGRTEWEHKPQYLSVQADMGEVTGAQASIHARAKVALDQILPLLDGLKPLRPDVDEEDVEAMRSIIRTELGELVQELGIVGGPRVARVDSLFEQLLGTTERRSENGHLHDLADLLGLRRKEINTVEDEQCYTEYLIIVQSLDSLRVSWNPQKASFHRDSADPYLGTGLAHLAQVLGVIAESVHEVYAAMDSVCFGPAERQVAVLKLPGRPPISVSELLSWIESFATDEGRQLITDGGRAGIRAARVTIVRLSQLAEEAAQIRSSSGSQLAGGYWTNRVQRSLREVATNLVCAMDIADRLVAAPKATICEAPAHQHLQRPERHAAIEKLAYLLSQKRSEREGSMDQDWYDAEKILAALWDTKGCVGDSPIAAAR